MDNLIVATIALAVVFAFMILVSMLGFITYSYIEAFIAIGGELYG